MNRETKNRRAPLFNRGLNAAAIALFASLAGSPLAHAASFRCPHSASASERLVCGDPALSSLDDQLAALYRNAVDASNDAAALEADRVSQWQWRQHNCKDKACVTDWYNRRIAELQGDVQHGKRAAAQRVKDSVVDQHLAPSAQDAVLEMKHIETKPNGRNTANDATDATNAGAKAASAGSDTLHLKKMPSGLAADARAQRLAEAHRHHLPPGDVAPSAMEAKMAASGGAFAKAAGIAPIDATTDAPTDAPAAESTDAPRAHRQTEAETAAETEAKAANHAQEKAPDQAETAKAVAEKAADHAAESAAPSAAKPDAAVALK